MVTHGWPRKPEGNVIDMSIIQQGRSKLNFFAHFSAEDLKTEINRLESQIAIAKDELLDFSSAHQNRPYSSEYFNVMAGGFRNSIRELRAQVRKVREYLVQKEALAN